MLEMLGTEVAKSMKEELIHEVNLLKEKGINPCLGILRIGEKQDDLSYERSAKKKMELLGIECKVVSLKEDVGEEELIRKFKKMNKDSSIHGILVFQPLPSHLDIGTIKKLMNPLKDVDGMTNENIAKVFSSDDTGFSPCTAEAGVKILDYYGIDVTGKKVVIVGRSMIVGKPISMMLLKKNATVTICHTKTKDLAEETSKADILVAAVGKPKMIKKEMVKKDSIIVDVGINVDENGNLCGDVDFESVKDKVSAITPVPKGVGSVTTSILASHVLRSANYLNE